MLNTTDEEKKRNILIGFVLLLFIHLVFVFAGFYNNDDINYARYAADITHNGISFMPGTNHYQLRWIVIYTSAFFYKCFGINSFSSTLCSFISIILCGIILKKILSRYKPEVYFVSLLFFFFAHSILFYMHRLLPDPTMCVAVLWMYFSYRSYSIKKDKPLNYGLQFSLALLLAIMTKETIIIVLPLFIAFFFIDVLKKRRLFFWLYAIPFASLLVFLYLLYFKLTTGLFFYRYYILQADSYFSICSFDKLPLAFTIRRIGYELWQAMLLDGDLLILLPALAAFIYRKKIAFYTETNNIDFYSFLFLLCSANFMTISFTAYVPLCQDPRHFLFLFPFAAIIAGPMCFAYFKDPAKFLLLPFFLIVATIIMFYLHAGTTKYLYLLFSLILIARFAFVFLNNHKGAYKIFIAAIVILFFINYVIDFIKPPFPYYWDHKRLVDKCFVGKNISAKVFSADELSGELTEFFLQFKNQNLQILPMDSVKATNSGTLYYLIVGDINHDSQTRINDLLKKDHNPKLFLVDKEQNVSLYSIDDSSLQMLK